MYFDVSISWKFNGGIIHCWPMLSIKSLGSPAYSGLFLRIDRCPSWRCWTCPSRLRHMVWIWIFIYTVLLPFSFFANGLCCFCGECELVGRYLLSCRECLRHRPIYRILRNLSSQMWTILSFEADMLISRQCAGSGLQQFTLATGRLSRLAGPCMGIFCYVFSHAVEKTFIT